MADPRRTASHLDRTRNGARRHDIGRPWPGCHHPRLQFGLNGLVPLAESPRDLSHERWWAGAEISFDRGEVVEDEQRAGLRRLAGVRAAGRRRRWLQPC